MLSIIMLLAIVATVLYLTDASASGAREPQTHEGKTAQQWHWRYVRAHRAHSRLGILIRRERRQRRHVFIRDASYAISLASSVFRVSASEMWSVARCETGGTFSPYAKNSTSSASGLFQFLDSTWANQGVGGFSVFDPVANALGAARIVSREGWRQWSCKP